MITNNGFTCKLNGSEIELPFKTQPYHHQLECLKKYADKPFYALLAEMGTGKTWIAINNYAYLFYNGLVRKMLVVAPNGVQWNWVENELSNHLITLSSKDDPSIIYAGYSGSMNSKDKKQFEDFMKLQGLPGLGAILCINWESLSNAKGRDIINTFLGSDYQYNMITLDESDYCKNITSQRTKFVLSMYNKAAYRRIMTGTPITNSPFDIYTQFKFLSPSIIGINSYFAFKNRYGVFLPNDNPLVQAIINRTRARNVQVPLVKDGKTVYKNLDELTNKIEPYSFRVTKAECLDLPPKIYKNEYITLTPDIAKAYKRMKDEGVLALANVEVPVINKIAILTKLCQITGNNFKLDDEKTVKIDNKHNPKLERCMEIIAEALGNNQQVIVWCRYRAEIQDLIQACRMAKIPAVNYFGDTAGAEKKAAIEAFQSGAAKVFISNPQSGGTGITLTAASVVIYYSNSFSLHDRLQSEDRAHRIGQNSDKVLYINLLARNTVDEYIQFALSNKLDISKSIVNFNNIKKYL